MNLTKREITGRVVEWLDALQSYEVRSEHPLVAVQSLRLAAGGKGLPIKETRPQGRSRPPIRDMSHRNSRTGYVMQHVRDVDMRYHQALCYYATIGNYDGAAVELKISKPHLIKLVGEGCAVFRSARLFI